MIDDRSIRPVERKEYCSLRLKPQQDHKADMPKSGVLALAIVQESPLRGVFALAKAVGVAVKVTFRVFPS
jgi:DUF1009 family protein